MRTQILSSGVAVLAGAIVLGACGGYEGPGPAPPWTPSNLRATATSASEISLTWQDNSDDETQWAIARCRGACTIATAYFEGRALVTLPGPSWTDGGLNSGSTYTYHVAAVGKGGYSNWSNLATATTFGPPPPVPAAPTLSYSEGFLEHGGGFYVALWWQANSHDEDGFSIDRCIGWGCDGFVRLASTTAGERHYSDTDLGALTSRSYRVRAFNAGGTSDPSNVVSAGPPAPPTSLVATAVAATQTSLTWQDNSSNEASFDIERCSGAACTGLTKIATVAANTTRYDDEGLTGGTSYTYRVSVNSWLGPPYSNYSNTATVTTP